jgi:ParB family chromosome partitioning protein
LSLQGLYHSSPRLQLQTYLCRAEESSLGSILVELTIVLSAARNNGAQVLRDAASAYKVDTDAIALKVKQEFAAQVKAKTEKKAKPTPAARALKRTA